MAVQSYTSIIKSITLHKFKSLSSGKLEADKINSIDILPQVHEVNIYESIFSPLMKCDLSVIDMIGLFVNFPMTGEEAITINYTNTADKIERKLMFIIDDISNIMIGKENRTQGFLVNCVAIEGYANNVQTVQQAYDGDIPNIVKQLFNEHITERMIKIFPGYKPPNFFSENNETQNHTVVIPNQHPIAAIDMLSRLAVPEVDDRYTYTFFQTAKGFKFATIQGMFSGINARRFARTNAYKFFSNEITETESIMNNQERVIAHVNINRRNSALSKMSNGYFHNNLFEINIAQKAIHSEHARLEDVEAIYDHKLNTEKYISDAQGYAENEENSNRTRYKLTTEREGDRNYPVSRMRQRWGKDLIARVGLSQIDLTISIPGTNRFEAGDLIYIEIPEVHGFNEVKEDELISGYFLITELKHVIAVGGGHTIVMKLNKDSYKTTVDKESKYA